MRSAGTDHGAGGDRTACAHGGGSSRPLALTMGDPAGIGLEIALAAWALRSKLGLPPFVLFADRDAVAQRARMLSLDVPIREVDDLLPACDAFAQALPLRHVGLAVASVPGRPDTRNAEATIAAISDAVDAVVSGAAAAVVTNPIAKSVLKSAGFAHPGHTEFLAHLAGGHGGRTPTPLMMLAAEELRVVPLTIHVPLTQVSTMITQDLIIEAVRILTRALEVDFGVSRPRVAVAGLNPHAGEQGTMGREEILTIVPALERLSSEGFDVAGPLPADTMFHAGMRATYDAALAMYHDQALIPLKTLAFDRGVNVTLGLPFVRTSPDHGTAFDISGKGLASATSLVEALRLADQLASRRQQHARSLAASDGAS